MFNDWKQEKAIVALIDEAQALADKLDSAKPHMVQACAAATRFWATVHLAEGQDLYGMRSWKPADAARFATKTQTKIAALRKARDYDSSEGLAVWLHTARSVAEPRILPAVRSIWQALLTCGPNADGMARDLIAAAGLTVDAGLGAPEGFGTDLS